MKEILKLRIKGRNIPSSKNSKRLVRGRIIHNKLTMDFKDFSKPFFTSNKEMFIKQSETLTKPLKIGFYFYRDSKRKFDYINMAQIVQDLMVEHEWIEDDNMTELIPVFIGYEVVKKEESGCDIILYE